VGDVVDRDCIDVIYRAVVGVSFMAETSWTYYVSVDSVAA
jgi:hypothetical protein